jgi:hypothetical protein
VWLLVCKFKTFVWKIGGGTNSRGKSKISEQNLEMYRVKFLVTVRMFGIVYEKT